METLGETETRASREARATFRKREGRPLFFADWEPVLFLHFTVPPSLLQPHVPFRLDLFAGNAFVTLVAFTFSNFRIRGLGRMGAHLLHPFLTSRFLNIRTYVQGPEGPGIFFLREYLSNPLTVPLGPPSFGLPYHHGSLDHQAEPKLKSYHAETHTGSTVLKLTGHRRKGEWAACKPASLAEFLLERYIAYTEHRKKSRFFRIWHTPWPQMECDAVHPETLPEEFGSWALRARFAGAHLSPGVRDVWLGRPRRIPRTGNLAFS